MSEKKSWRDVYKVHPAADLFPMLPPDELRELGEDIKKNGLKEPVIIWSSGNRFEPNQPYILDGRNRLDAMELVGLKIMDGDKLIDFDGRKFVSLHLSEYVELGKGNVVPDITNPASYVISKNIHRRHLTKEQQADLIVKVMKAQNDFAKIARSFNPEVGKKGGSTKDTFKEKVVEEAKKHGISKRTAETSLAKDRGPAQKPRENGQGKQQPEEQTGAWSMKKTLDRIRDKLTLSRSQLENENRFLLAKITDLQVELSEARTDLFMAQMKQVEKYFNSGLQEMNMDLRTWRKYLAKKYHPDHNSSKTFTAGEVMADINPLLDGISREHTGV